MSWGSELWDQFDNLEKHTQWGIEFVEKYTKFVKERSEIEINYAKQIRNLSKKYQPKKNSREEEESKYTFCRAFLTTLNELNDYAGQHEVIAENLTAQIISELSRYLQELKGERKSGSGPEDFSHLPPEQRRKKLQGKIDDLNKDIQKEMDQRDAVAKMKDVYEKNPQMGDAASLEPRLSETGQNIEKLQFEVQKFEGWLAEVEERMPSKSDTHRRSGVYETQNSTTVSNNCAQDRESPDGSYTEEQNSETQVKANPNPAPTTNPMSTTPEFDDEFDDEETLPTIGSCKALYPFEGHNEGTISVVEGEVLYVIEEDKGDGWTRVRRSEDEEGYVPTSYIEVLETNAKDS